MFNCHKVIKAVWVPVAALAILSSASAAPVAGKVEVAAYYFGNYHQDRRNEAFHGKGWNEWKLVKEAKPRFEGHYQPRVPVWGYEDEADPQAMARKIDAAAKYGVDAFIFDWYYYEDGPFLERSLDEGFLNAPNNDKVKFALMWANHDWTDIHPKRRAVKKPQLLYPGKVSPEQFDRICDLVIARYLKHPSYWKIGGKPYFSIYELPKFLENFGGSADAAKSALERFRKKAVAAGLPGLHLNTIYCGQRILPQETAIKDVFELTKFLGFDSATSYTWLHHVEMTDLTTKFDFVRDGYLADWAGLLKRFRIPYIPNASVGWDSSPRADQRDEYGNFGYPFCSVIVDNGPDRFRAALLEIRRRLDADPSQLRIVTVNSWNEWTEGSYLEPDEKYGYGYLEAIRQVFGK